MRLSISKCMSLLVASGNGQKCNDLKRTLQQNMLMIDAESGLSKTYLQKYGRADHLEDHTRVMREVATAVRPFLKGIPDHIYGDDKVTPVLERN